MDAQLSIFDIEAHYRTTDPVTSRAAAVAVGRSGRALGDARRLLRVLQFHGPMTSKQAGVIAGIERHAAGRRFSTLKNAGKILFTGRQNSDGQIWEAVNGGL